MTITMISGNGFVMSGEGQYAICHDCGDPIDFGPGAPNAPERYPVELRNGGIRYQCHNCRDDNGDYTGNDVREYAAMETNEPAKKRNGITFLDVGMILFIVALIALACWMQP